MKRAARVVLCLSCLLAGVPGQAGDALPTGTFSVILENDLFYDIDRHYTNGIGFVWIPDRSVGTPDWAEQLARLVPWFPQEGEVRHGYAFGQSMFTPSDITIADPPPGERPYAGWLYGTFGLGASNGRQLDLLALSVGMVGPASQAEQSQKFVHDLIGADEPMGWDTQLGDEPGFVLTYLRSWRGQPQPGPLGTRYDLTQHFGGAFGNVFTYLNTGLTLRVGQNLPRDFGPPRIQPGVFGSGEFVPTPGFSWYLFAAVEGRAVARNIFLDGNCCQSSRSVDREPLVGDLQFGLVLDWSDFRLSYTRVLRTREFDSQDKNDDFGAVSLSVKF